jgi:hypothetical protein
MPASSKRYLLFFGLSLFVKITFLLRFIKSRFEQVRVALNLQKVKQKVDGVTPKIAFEKDKFLSYRGLHVYFKLN